MARQSASGSTSKSPALPMQDGAILKREEPHDDNIEISSSTDTLEDPTTDGYPVSFDPTLLPGGSRDLSFIGLQAFVLGNGLAGSLCLAAVFIYNGQPWWRLPAFLASLSLFHFLEYWTTAKYNVPAVRASSFLLFNNGRAYTMAHAMATFEILISNFFPRYRNFMVSPITIGVGAALMVVCQIVRSVAMAQAGNNFNHLVAIEHKAGHELVTDGIYAYLRHPSYFGFFWWAVGTQLFVGNKVCLVGYVVVLWRFFSRRVRAEEKYLVSFFGEKYEVYRKRTGTMIPFVG